MLRKLSALKGYHLYTNDNEQIGNVQDFYFDRDDWAVRYLVADIGSWFTGRRVLIAPAALGTPDWDAQLLPVGLTKAQVKESPTTDFAQPVTRQHEAELSQYYGWPSYWATPMTVAAGGMAPALAGMPPAEPDVPDPVVQALQNTEESHLLSTRDTRGYTIEATDGGIGHVEDFFVDDQDWRIRYLLIDTGNWLAGKQVLFAPRWVRTIDWNDGRLYVDVTRNQVQESPEYNPAGPLERTYERDLHQYWGYPEYW